MAALIDGSDAPAVVDDRAESPAAFGSLDSLTGLRDGYVMVPIASFALNAGVWLQPDASAAPDTQGTWGILS